MKLRRSRFRPVRFVVIAFKIGGRWTALLSADPQCAKFYLYIIAILSANCNEEREKALMASHKIMYKLLIFYNKYFTFAHFSCKIFNAFLEILHDKKRGICMRFFQKIGNAFSRFMYGRNGSDYLGMTTLWLAIVLDVINIFIKNDTAHLVIGIFPTALLAWTIFRMFSRNLQKRRAENAWFMNRCWYPVVRGFRQAKQKSMDKEHKYFTCPQCRTVCRVPRGKGKIVITCPKCRHQIHGKS